MMSANFGTAAARSQQTPKGMASLEPAVTYSCVGALYKCIMSTKSWEPISQGYINFDIIHTPANVERPFSIQSRQPLVSGVPFTFHIISETRARLTKATFLQWHLKGSPENFGLQLIDEEQANTLQRVIAKAIEMTRKFVPSQSPVVQTPQQVIELDKEKEHRLMHLNRTGQTAEAFQLLESVTKGETKQLMMRVHLPDNGSTMIRIDSDAKLENLLLLICEKRNLEPSTHALADKVGKMYDATSLTSMKVSSMGSHEVELVDLTTRIGGKSKKADEMKMLAEHALNTKQIDMGSEVYIHVHLPDGGKTVVKLPKNTSMGELLFHIAEKRGLDIGEIEMASSSSGKKLLSVKGTIDQNGVKEVFLVQKNKNRKGGKGLKKMPTAGLPRVGAVRKAEIGTPLLTDTSHPRIRVELADSKLSVDPQTQRVTSLLAEGVSAQDPRLPEAWRHLFVIGCIDTTVLNNPGQRQRLLDIIAANGGPVNMLKMGQNAVRVCLAQNAAVKQTLNPSGSSNSSIGSSLSGSSWQQAPPPSLTAPVRPPPPSAAALAGSPKPRRPAPKPARPAPAPPQAQAAAISSDKPKQAPGVTPTPRSTSSTPIAHATNNTVEDEESIDADASEGKAEELDDEYVEVEGIDTTASQQAAEPKPHPRPSLRQSSDTQASNPEPVSRPRPVPRAKPRGNASEMSVTEVTQVPTPHAVRRRTMLFPPESVTTDDDNDDDDDDESNKKPTVLQIMNDVDAVESQTDTINLESSEHSCESQTDTVNLQPHGERAVNILELTIDREEVLAAPLLGTPPDGPPPITPPAPPASENDDTGVPVKNVEEPNISEDTADLRDDETKNVSNDDDGNDNDNDDDGESVGDEDDFIAPSFAPPPPPPSTRTLFKKVDPVAPSLTDILGVKAALSPPPASPSEMNSIDEEATSEEQTVNKNKGNSDSTESKSANEVSPRPTLHLGELLDIKATLSRVPVPAAQPTEEREPVKNVEGEEIKKPVTMEEEAPSAMSLPPPPPAEFTSPLPPPVLSPVSFAILESEVKEEDMTVQSQPKAKLRSSIESPLPAFVGNESPQLFPAKEEGHMPPPSGVFELPPPPDDLSKPVDFDDLNALPPPAINTPELNFDISDLPPPNEFDFDNLPLPPPIEEPLANSPPPPPTPPLAAASLPQSASVVPPAPPAPSAAQLMAPIQPSSVPPPAPGQGPTQVVQSIDVPGNRVSMAMMLASGTARLKNTPEPKKVHPMDDRSALLASISLGKGRESLRSTPKREEPKERSSTMSDASGVQMALCRALDNRRSAMQHPRDSVLSNDDDWEE